MEVLMTFAAKISEVPNFGKKVVTVANREVLLVKIKEAIFACENECPHQGAPMTASVIKDKAISCPRHGYRFSLVDGSCPDHPEFVLKIFPVTLQGDDIFITLD